ncbi:hypothetical protein SLA2020_379180 [Shorea laevis]
MAQEVPMQIGSWSRELNLNVVPMKDFKMVLGHKFINRLMPFTFTKDGHIHFEDGGVCYKVPLERLPSEGTVLAAMKVTRGIE